MDEISEITVGNVNTKLQIIESQFGRVLKDILKLQLQVEILERNVGALATIQHTNAPMSI